MRTLQGSHALLTTGSCAQVFVDAEGVVYGFKPPQPKGSDWPEHVRYFYEKLKLLKDELHISSDENLRHSRGRFTRFSCGTSHGGGQTVRALANSRPLVLTFSAAANGDLPGLAPPEE